jgi:hypothetical protein
MTQTAADAQGLHALRQAADLSRRARRGSEAARRLARQLAHLPATGTAAVPEPPASTMAVGCTTCDDGLEVALDDPHLGAAQARAFFVRHGDCLTFVDLDRLRALSRHA